MIMMTRMVQIQQEAGLAHVTTSGTRSVPSLPMRQVITSFAGNRAHEDGHEFIIEELKDAPFFVDCAGIESPGLSSAPLSVREWQQ